MNTLSEAFEKLGADHAALALERLGAFNSHLPQGEAWSFDLHARTFTMGRTTIAIQVIGTFSAEHAAWVWAWDNASLQQFPEAIADAWRVREYGERYGIPEFVDRGVDLSGFADPRFGAEKLALIATAVLGAKGYAGVTTSGGFRAYLVSNDPAIPERGPRGPEHVSHYLRTAADWFPTANPMTLAAAYATGTGGRWMQVPGGLVVNLGEGSMTLHYREGRLDRVGPPVALV
ncbi:DUF6882 domain-containing protein [Micromonospora sp. HM5-17]|uniref:DUF6882 domain-containing protein n=1 Tax=Micromonospora sp. HM5-17 TaxID=2487710 RepID=UPI0011CDA181|nr:DUF6882 domain-containing protein [Micromonospora sp. HM5-17]